MQRQQTRQAFGFVCEQERKRFGIAARFRFRSVWAKGQVRIGPRAIHTDYPKAIAFVREHRRWWFPSARTIVAILFPDAGLRVGRFQSVWARLTARKVRLPQPLLCRPDLLLASR